MNTTELSGILEKHKLWLNGVNGGERADLRGADLDFSSFPLWCGSLDIKVDDRLPVQLIYHICRMEIKTEDEDLRELIGSELFRKVANKFHRVEECGKIRKKEEEE